MVEVMVVGLGGFLGSISRYLIYEFEKSFFKTIFPYGTLLINLSGCFLTGVLFTLIQNKMATSHAQRELTLFTLIGFIGSFTTFSSFAFDNLTLLREGQTLLLLLYTIASLVLGVVSVFMGQWLVIKFVP